MPQEIRRVGLYARVSTTGVDEKVLNRFWSKVDKSGPVPEHRPELGPCWMWLGAPGSHGYGCFCIGKAMQLAHRMAWTIQHGPIPQSASGRRVCVLHKCDVPMCVNWGHLFLGDDYSNAMDREAKGRGNQAWGERGSHARLTVDAVLSMRARYAAGGITQQALATEHGVSPGAVSAIVHRRTWRRLK